MNDQELLVSNGVAPVAVVGRVGRGEDFMLIHLDGDVSAGIAEAQAKGFCFFAGAMAVLNGQAVAKCNPGLDNMRAMMNAAFEYARLVADRLKQQAGDEVEWLNRLYALEDRRTEL